MRKSPHTAWALLLNQFRSPLVLLLLAAMAISLSIGERMDVLMVLAVVLMSTLLGFWQEYRASNAVAALLNLIQTKATVLRDGIEVEIPADEVVKGDMINVPQGTLHWFDLCTDRTVRAIRLFQDMSGWTPEYTDSGVDGNYAPQCFGPAGSGATASVAGSLADLLPKN